MNHSQKLLQIKKMSNLNEVAVFIHENGKFDNLNTDISSFPLINLWNLYNNILVYTTFEDAEFADKLPTKTKKIFYLWDLEWINSQNPYSENLRLINSADVLMCRCEAHAEMIEKYFGRKPIVLKEFNYDEFKKYEN